MTANPVELIGGMSTTADVSKADIVSWAKARLIPIMADATEVNGTTLTGQKYIYVGSLDAIFKADLSDTTSLGNGTSIILSGDTSAIRFKIVSSIPTPTDLSLGGVFSSDAPDHQFAVGVDLDGNVLYEQPAAADLTNGTTGSGAVVLATAPAIAGGTHDGLTSLGIRSTAVAYDVKFASAETLSTTRTLSMIMGDANRSITLAGNLSYGGAFTMSGAYAFTGTLTGATGVTFPTTGTLATIAGVETPINKIFNAANNTVTNLTTAMFATNVVDTDGTLAANSDTRIASQKATKTYLDQIIAAADAMVFKGVVDCSANPNYPAADRGWTYKVSVAGKIGGASGVTVDVGDTLMCLTDSTASGNEATVGTAWNIVQANLVGAVTGPASSTSGNAATFNGTGGKVIQDSGKALPTGTIVGTSDSQALTGKTYNGLTVTSTTGTITLAAGKTLTVSNTLTITGTDSSTIAFGAGGTVLYSGGALGTPSGGTATNLTGLPISTGLTGAGTGVLAALAVAIGSAGAPVLFNGAGGTPSSLTLTNATGLPTAGLVNNAVTLAKLATVSTATFLGRTTASTGNVEALTATQATALLNAMVGDSGSGGTKGLVPAAGAGDYSAGKFLTAGGTFEVPAGSGGGGMTDSERQNFLLSTVYQAKSFLGFRRLYRLFADGFMDASGIASLTNGARTSTSPAISYIAPTMGSGTTGTFAQGSVGGVGLNTGSGQNGAIQFTAPATGTLTTLRVNANTVAVNGDWVAELWTSSVQTIGSGNPGSKIGSSSSAVTISSTGDKTISWSGTGPSMTSGTVYFVVLKPASGTPNFSADVYNTIAGYRSGRNNTITSITPNDFGSGFGIRMEINYSTGVNAMTLVTTAQTASSSVSNGRVLVEFDNTDTPTLNTDLTVEVTCDGGSNWATATLSSVGTGQGGRAIAETADTTCTSGTSIQARVKTLNGKNVPVYGVALMWH